MTNKQDTSNYLHYVVLGAYILSCIGIFTGLILNIFILIGSILTMLMPHNKTSGLRRDILFLIRRNFYIIIFSVVPVVMLVTNGIRVFTTPISDLGWGGFLISIVVIILCFVGVIYNLISILLRLDSLGVR